MRRSGRAAAFCTAMLAAVMALSPAPCRAEKKSDPARPRPRVLAASFSGIITPVAAEFMQSALDKAAAETFDAVVIELDTPGGLDLPMRDIVKAILGSEVPVIVYVSPAGARAASAGVFITMAAHVAAMAPGTNIGAAHPVALGGGIEPPAFGKDKAGEKGGAKGALKGSPSGESVMEAKLAHDLGAGQREMQGREWSRQDVGEVEDLDAI